MLYLNHQSLEKLGVDWNNVIDELLLATKEVHSNNYDQPIKTYLRYGDKRNRIIAMPAYLGGKIHASGIKWIASFPKNLEKGLNRASSVTVLNDADTGYPNFIVNTATISAIRTVGVTGMVLKKLILEQGKANSINRAGIIGFGPIGKMHLSILAHFFGKHLERVVLYDVREIDIANLGATGEILKGKIETSDNWLQAYKDMDLVITCTNTNIRYIDSAPKRGSFQMNISLRDYDPQIKRYIDFMIVDNWKEVCREDTDIEAMHKKFNLQRSDVHELPQLLFGSGRMPSIDDTVMFNPMGMSIYDIAIARYYFQLATQNGIGVRLD